jgi:hypothetical protein
MRFLLTFLLLIPISALATKNATCPSIEEVVSRGNWNLSPPKGWQIASYVENPGPCPLLSNVAWAPNGDHDLYIQCWYQSNDGLGALMLYAVATTPDVSSRYIRILSEVSCQILFGPIWSQFVDPFTNKTKHLYNCDINYDEPKSGCPKPQGACFWQPVPIGANVTFPECRS